MRTSARTQTFSPGSTDGFPAARARIFSVMVMALMVPPPPAGDERDEILVVDVLLRVGERLEAVEDAVHVDLADLEAELLESRDQRVTPGVLAEDQAVRVEPDRLGLHDLVIEAVLQDPVLVDAGLVREGVVADDRLVDRDRDAGDLREEATGRVDLLGDDAGVDAEPLAPGVNRHHDLLHGGVPGALADAV